MGLICPANPRQRPRTESGSQLFPLAPKHTCEERKRVRGWWREKASQESNPPSSKNPERSGRNPLGPHLSLSDRRRSSGGTGVPGRGGEVYPCSGEAALLSGSAGEKSLLAASRAPCAPVRARLGSARLWALRSGSLVRLWWGTRPPHSLSSLRVHCSLPAGSRGRDTLFHAE